MSTESFTAKIQKAMRIQIPVLLRWRYQLNPGTILKVQITGTSPPRRARFYGRMQKSGRITVPRLVAETTELKNGDIVEVTVWIQQPPIA